MRLILHALLALTLTGCAALGLGAGERPAREVLWTEAHGALAAGEYDRAGDLFQQLADQYPGSEAGRESLFYVGTIRMDPRNPKWNPEPAERALRRYVEADSGTTVNRRPEAETLLRLAEQLNMPAEQRVPGLQPERVVVRETQVVARASDSRALAAEVERLRKELADREARIAQQEEELERIRRTLTGRKPPGGR